MEDKKLEEIMRTRNFEEASNNLEDRIVAMAELTPQKRSEPETNLWEEFSYIFWNAFIPKPVYAVASLSIIGFFIGYADPMGLEPSSIVDLGDFLYADQGGLL